MKLLDNMRKRRDKRLKRKSAVDALQEERLLRLKRAQDDLATAMEEGPLVVDASAFTADMDEVEPESEFNCFHCQVRHSSRLQRLHCLGFVFVY